MALTVPTTVPQQYTAWDVEEELGSWSKRFADANRLLQETRLLTGVDVENGAGNMLLRRYASIVAHEGFVAKGAIQNVTEFKLGGVINVALNQGNKLGLVWNYRPIIPREQMPVYRFLWNGCANLLEPKLHPDDPDIRLSIEKRMLQYKAFLLRVAPLLGMWSLELPRGYGDVTKTPVQNAESEAEEELQVRCVERFELGLLGEDTAQNPALNSYCFVRMDVKGKPRQPRDLWEKIAAKAEWLTLSELAQAFKDGHVVDPYTLAALQVLQFERPDLYASIGDPRRRQTRPL